MPMHLMLWGVAALLGVMWLLRRSSKPKNHRGY